jgi:hypothetical protein
VNSARDTHLAYAHVLPRWQRGWEPGEVSQIKYSGRTADLPGGLAASEGQRERLRYLPISVQHNTIQHACGLTHSNFRRWTPKTERRGRSTGTAATVRGQSFYGQSAAPSKPAKLSRLLLLPLGLSGCSSPYRCPDTSRASFDAIRGSSVHMPRWSIASL